MHSIRRRLLFTLLGALLAAGLGAAIGTFFSAQLEIDSLLDGELQQVALSLRDHASIDLNRLQRAGESPEHRVLVQITDPINNRIYLSRPAPALPLAEGPGYSTISHAGARWRMFSVAAGDQFIQVAQPTALRTELAVAAAWRILLPVLILLPFLGVAVWIMVGQGLAPLNRVAQAVRRRSPTSLEPLPTRHLPEELEPLAGALNDLLGRLGQSFDAQRRFAADAAHELRTPLTALTLQIQLAERAATPEDRARSFTRLKEGVKRATRLVQQLLTMARLDPDAADKPTERVDLDRLAASVADELHPLADQKHITISTQLAPAAVLGAEDALRLLANNLVDNAIRYTPEGGRIELRVRQEDGQSVLEVADNGPGVAPEERGRVFDRFYRAMGTAAPGSGLGLAIVHQVAAMHGGFALLTDGLDGRGVTLRVVMPAAA
ncbi:MAG: ATP-binding protein [Burkholderiaceae bacterium]